MESAPYILTRINFSVFCDYFEWQIAFWKNVVLSFKDEHIVSLTASLYFSAVCGCDLAQGGFFVRQGEFICTLDYQRLYGTRCFSCEEFIEGEVVSALGKTYHPRCFVCATCK